MEFALGKVSSYLVAVLNADSIYGEQPFHQDGMVVVSKSPLQIGTFEGDSFNTLKRVCL